YLTGNSLNGTLPNWIRYGNGNDGRNLFRSYSGGEPVDLGNKCLKGFPCSKTYYSVHINCGGLEVKIGNKVFEGDQDQHGAAAKFVPTNTFWGFSSTGYPWDVDLASVNHTTTSVSTLTMNSYELYTNARQSSLSLTYYGRCLANGNYTVTLYFAEIVFTDKKSFRSLGRRVFDVYVQINGNGIEWAHKS
ncbi:probable LRR receptor-like serine/threonine-protein kinase isoform X1, partial [Tanacetum coccineum]